MPVDFKTLADVFGFHQQLGPRFAEQLKGLRNLTPQGLPDLFAGITEDALKRAKAALAQANDERTQGLRRLDQRIVRRQAEVARLETELKRSRDTAKGIVKQVSAAAAGAGGAEGGGAGEAAAADRATAAPKRPGKRGAAPG